MVQQVPIEVWMSWNEVSFLIDVWNWTDKIIKIMLMCAHCAARGYLCRSAWFLVQSIDVSIQRWLDITRSLVLFLPWERIPRTEWKEARPGIYLNWMSPSSLILLLLSHGNEFCFLQSRPPYFVSLFLLQWLFILSCQACQVFPIPHSYQSPHHACAYKW